MANDSSSLPAGTRVRTWCNKTGRIVSVRGADIYVHLDGERGPYVWQAFQITAVR